MAEVADSVVVVSETAIQQKILVVRGIPVMLDSDLALLYQIETKNLKRQVRRNLNRFPSDFMFELSDEEAINLRCQNVTSSTHGGNRYRPISSLLCNLSLKYGVLRTKIVTADDLSLYLAFWQTKIVRSNNLKSF